MKAVVVVLGILGILIGTRAVAAKERVITLSIQGMTCSMSPVTVRKALEKQEGVSVANVLLEQPLP